ncbi:hypothetical protein Pcinc_042099 [Petrolisthes cinctipes]|uniref:Uncharacterized protein n=1 Tax=Petrolisthes cinctipes TaxID=88211 RepID=A0AAE1EGA5_PETCI|nr:hypothetical protein Pcinc_042099 [Petrolisthes cinctipes]
MGPQGQERGVQDHRVRHGGYGITGAGTLGTGPQGQTQGYRTTGAGTGVQDYRGRHGRVRDHRGRQGGYRTTGAGTREGYGTTGADTGGTGPQGLARGKGTEPQGQAGTGGLQDHMGWRPHSSVFGGIIQQNLHNLRLHVLSPANPTHRDSTTNSHTADGRFRPLGTPGIRVIDGRFSLTWFAACGFRLSHKFGSLENGAGFQ